MRKTIAVALLALGLASLAAPALAQTTCGVTPALPDTERRTEYSISASTGPLNVNFQIYGDSTDFANWVEVWVAGVKKTAVTDYTVTSPSGTIGTICRPISDAQVTFVAAQTGTVEIVGARRPRRASQVSENRGITAHDFNQTITDMTAQLREAWDIRSRLFLASPGQTGGVITGATGVFGPGSSTDKAIVRFLGSTGGVVQNSSATIGDLGTVTVAPSAASTAQGIVVNQTSPTTGSVAGPLIFNNIAINNQSGVTGSGATNSLLNASTRGLQVNMTEGGSNISGIQSAAVFQLNHTVGNSSAVGGDHVATISTAYSNKVEGGGGGIYGLDAISWAAAGSSMGAVTGINSETYVDSAATVPYRLGIEITNIGPAVGSTFDAAIAIDNTALGGAFLNGISFGANPIRPQPIAVTGSLFSTAQNFTVANIMNFPGLTVTGNYFNLGHLAITGTGFISSAANNAALPTAPAGTQIVASAGDATLTYIMSDAFSTNGGAYFLSRSARGTSASPTALQSGDTMGGLVLFGRGATGYSSGGRASIYCVASQTWTDAAQGTYCELGTTTNGGTAQTARVRWENDGGLAVPPTVSGGSKGAGTLNISSGYYINGSAILAPLSYTSPLSYNAGTGAVSLTTVPVNLGGTNCAVASATCLDNITGFTTTGLVTRAGAGSYFSRTLQGGSGISVTNGDGVAANPSIALSAPVSVANGGTNCITGSGTCLDNIAGFAATGMLSRTGAGAYSARTIGSGTGITVTNGDGVSGAPSVALTVPVVVSSGGTNCVAASGTCLDNITGFASTGLIARTASGTYAARTIGSGAGIAVTNGDGVAGAPSIAVSGLLTNTNFTMGAGSAAAFAPNVTNYAGFGTICASGSETSCPVPVSAPATMKNFYASTANAPSAGQTYTFTLRKNLADTTITCAISGASATTCSDLTHTVSVAAADIVDVKMVSSATATSTFGPTFTLTAVTTSP